MLFCHWIVYQLLRLRYIHLHLHLTMQPIQLPLKFLLLSHPLLKLLTPFLLPPRLINLLLPIPHRIQSRIHSITLRHSLIIKRSFLYVKAIEASLWLRRLGWRGPLSS